MKFRNKTKSILSAVLSALMLFSSAPITTYHVHAAQTNNDYVDPADHWVSTGSRTNELDTTATVTQETQYCGFCQRETIQLLYRVPEYTRSGETALNRGVQFSDGTLIGGEGKGNLDNGIPGVDAYYPGYHFTKSVCQLCGTINAIDGEDTYSYNNNVYGLNSCDNRFFLDFDSTSYEPYSSTQHTVNEKRGQYCQFCKGTYTRATVSRAAHNFDTKVDGQIGNNRFYVTDECDDCGYETSEYVTAKAVISSYYGVVDGEAHTLTVSDLSNRSVNTSIRYRGL